MTSIRPAILAKDEAEFIAKVARVAALGLPLHIDVMDGAFVPETTWAPPERMRELLGETPFEAHLMVSTPEHAVPEWIAAGADRVIYHLESTPRADLICRSVGEDVNKLVLAINIETSVADLVPHLHQHEHVMFMGVTPGASGRPFAPEILEKAAELDRLRPGISVTIDGGMSPATAKAAVAAGADHIVAGSALTNAPDPAAAYAEFLKAIGE